MRAWLSDGLIRLARRINPAARVETGAVNYYITGDPREAFRRVEDRVRASRSGFLR